MPDGYLSRFPLKKETLPCFLPCGMTSPLKWRQGGTVLKPLSSASIERNRMGGPSAINWKWKFLRFLSAQKIAYGALAQPVRAPACHVGGRGFKSLTHRQYAAVYGMVDEPVSKTGAGNSVWVRVPSAVLKYVFKRLTMKLKEIAQTITNYSPGLSCKTQPRKHQIILQYEEETVYLLSPYYQERVANG